MCSSNMTSGVGRVFVSLTNRYSSEWLLSELFAAQGNANDSNREAREDGASLASRLAVIAVGSFIC